MLKYILGAIVGGVLGYVILYRLIGCSGGSCPITSSPVISIAYGVILGVLFSAQM